jgi:Relaxase/Mobilisation nuclease domain
MIAKISKGSGFGGVVRYVLDKDKAHTMLDGAKNCRGEDAGEIASGFQAIAKRGNSRIPVRHYSIAFAHEDGEIDNDTKAEIVNRIMGEMGFGDCQYFAVSHDRDDPNHHEAHNHDHLHIIANAITPTGQRVPDSWDYHHLQRSLRGIEKDYGFRQVENSWEKARTPLPTKRTDLQIKIDQSLTDEPDLKTWIARLEAEGVNLRFRVTTRGCIQGISYVYEGELKKGGDIGAGWKSLSSKFGESPDHTKLAIASNTKTQSLPVTLRRHEQEQLVKMADLAVKKLRGQSKYKDKSVDIKLIDNILTVYRLRPSKRILSAKKGDNGQWTSIGVPDIDEKKDLNIFEPKRFTRPEKPELVTEGSPLQHLSQMTKEAQSIMTGVHPPQNTQAKENQSPNPEKKEFIENPIADSATIEPTEAEQASQPITTTKSPRIKSSRAYQR